MKSCRAEPNDNPLSPRSAASYSALICANKRATSLFKMVSFLLVDGLREIDEPDVSIFVRIEEPHQWKRQNVQALLNMFPGAGEIALVAILIAAFLIGAIIPLQETHGHNLSGWLQSLIHRFIHANEERSNNELSTIILPLCLSMANQRINCHGKE